MKTKPIKFDFYRPIKVAPSEAFMDIAPLLVARYQQSIPIRTQRSGGDAFRLGRLQVDGSIYIGDFIRINHDQPAMVAGTTVEERAVTDSDEEGMATAVAFLYDAQSHTVVFQRARGGLSPTDASSYLSSVGSEGTWFSLQPILRRDVESMLARMAHPRRLEFAASVGGLRPDDAQADSMRRVIDVANTTGSRTMRLELSAGGKKGLSLVAEQIGQFVRDAMRFRNEGRRVRQMKLKADFGGEAGPEVLDLLDASLVSIQFIQSTRDIEEYYRRRVEAIRAAWDANVRNV
jgi:hypothetical protein